MHLALVACGKNKQPFSCEAQDLYTGDLFKKASTWAKVRSDAWYILSAKHGLLVPTRTVEPYDQTLATMNRREREYWAIRVIRDIAQRHPECSEITFLAGKNYREYLERFAGNAQIKVCAPMAGLGIGRQLAWLKEATK